MGRVLQYLTNYLFLDQSKLPAVLRTYRDALTSDIKHTIKTVVAELLPILFVRPPDVGELPSADRQADLDGSCANQTLSSSTKLCIVCL